MPSVIFHNYSLMFFSFMHQVSIKAGIYLISIKFDYLKKDFILKKHFCVLWEWIQRVMKIWYCVCLIFMIDVCRGSPYGRRSKPIMPIMRKMFSSSVSLFSLERRNMEVKNEHLFKVYVELRRHYLNFSEHKICVKIVLI